jgi:hypothetical protein
MTLNSAKITAGTALRPVLEAFHAVDGQPLTSVSDVYEDGCLTAIVFTFERNTLTVAAKAEDDSVELSVTNSSGRPPAHDVSEREPWVTFIREPFGWGWLTLNQQGYCDGVLLSFRGIIPQLVLIVEASSLSVGTIKRLHPRSETTPD